MATLILMRHAARALNGDALSIEGRGQATRLGEILRTKGAPMPDQIQSSPKKRTQATVASLATELKLQVRVDRQIDERTSHESESEFEDRVKKYLGECDKWAELNSDSQNSSHKNFSQISSGQTRLVCSHLDWLEAAVLFLTSDETDLERSESWSPLAMRVYEYGDGIWKRLKLDRG